MLIGSGNINYVDKLSLVKNDSGIIYMDTVIWFRK